MLRLLAQREQGYDDIAALMGLSVDEVRGKVKDALAELDQGTAEPPPPPEPPPPVQEPPPPPPPEPAPPEPAPKPARPKPAAQAPRMPRPKGLPKDQGALRGLLAGAAVVIVIVLLLVTGVFGGDDGSGSTSASSEATSAESTSGEVGSGEGAPSAGGKQPTQAVLKAVNGSGASGQALFGRSEKNVVLLLAAKGLKPSPAGKSYTLSLVRSPTERLPLIATQVGKQGVISGRFQVAPQVLGLLAGGFDEMEVSLVPNDELKVALAQAKKAQKAPSYGGEAVLAGPVTGPIVEAGEKG
jgi:outer membrane biosynthesis protein TonB